MTRRALITGIAGQNGAASAALRPAKGYDVGGMRRCASSFTTYSADPLYLGPRTRGTRLFLHYGVIADATNPIRLVPETRPGEIHNLAAWSHVKASLQAPEYSANAEDIECHAPAWRRDDGRNGEELSIEAV